MALQASPQAGIRHGASIARGRIDTALAGSYIGTTMTTPASIGAFQVLARRDLPEYRSSALHVRHAATGCEVLHITAADNENLFAFCFATPPQDDTGVSHITEHSVLSGSRRFPLKEPFSALMKGSMHTFLNALTYPDRTVYPAASCTGRTSSTSWRSTVTRYSIPSCARRPSCRRVGGWSR